MLPKILQALLSGGVRPQRATQEESAKQIKQLKYKSIDGVKQWQEFKSRQEMEMGDFEEVHGTDGEGKTERDLKAVEMERSEEKN